MYTNDELSHHGILGQKWGVRRYQNKDGTLTSAGKKRVSKLSTKREQYANKLDTHANKAFKNGGKYYTEIGRGITEYHYTKVNKYSKKVSKLDKKIDKLIGNESVNDYLNRTKEYQSSGQDYILAALNRQK